MFSSCRLELLNRSATVNRSLLNELELSTDFRTTSGLSAASSGIGAEEDEIECDEPLPTSAPSLKEVSAAMGFFHCHSATHLWFHLISFFEEIEIEIHLSSSLSSAQGGNLVRLPLHPGHV